MLAMLTILLMLALPIAALYVLGALAATFHRPRANDPREMSSAAWQAAVNARLIAEERH